MSKVYELKVSKASICPISGGMLVSILPYNIIEGFHRQLRAITKSKGAFQSEDALMKLLFLIQENICAKWNKPVHNWNQTLAQLSIIFGDRRKLNL
nr:hypothetical protein [Chitinophaga terrae (ex Kim and Jung 2007)]